MSPTLVSEAFDFDWFVFVSTLFWKLKDCLIFSDRLVDGAQDGRQHWGSDWGDACRGEFVTNKQVSGDELFIEMVDWWLHPYSHVWIVNIPRHWISNACDRTFEKSFYDMFYSVDHFICEVLKFWVFLFNILNSHYNSYEERTHLRNMFLPFITQIAVPKSSQVEYSRKCDPFSWRESVKYSFCPRTRLCVTSTSFSSLKRPTLFFSKPVYKGVHK